MARYGSAAEKHEELYEEELYYYPETYARRPKYISREQARPKPKLDILIGNMDMTMFFVVIILVIIGIIMVLSSSYARMSIVRGDAFFLFRQHIPLALLGLAALIAASRIHYLNLRRFVWILYAVTIVFLTANVMVWLAAEGTAPQRWIAGFQPSELAKAAIIFAIAHLVAKYPGALKAWSNLAIFSAMVGALVALIWLPGGFSQGLIVAVIGFGMIFIASPHIWRFVVLGSTGVGLIAAYLGITMWLGTGFRGARVAAWMNPFDYQAHEGFQTIQGLYAIASGGLFGEGIGQSRQASSIPEVHNDFIFSVVVEELGLIGASLILLLFGILIWRGIVIAMRAPDTFGSMLAIGIVCAIGFQVVINVGVVTNTIPNTGVTLPFISYGGTSLVVFMGLVGVLLNISRYSKAEKERKPK